MLGEVFLDIKSILDIRELFIKVVFLDDGYFAGRVVVDYGVLLIVEILDLVDRDFYVLGIDAGLHVHEPLVGEYDASRYSLDDFVQIKTEECDGERDEDSFTYCIVDLADVGYVRDQYDGNYGHGDGDDGVHHDILFGTFLGGKNFFVFVEVELFHIIRIISGNPPWF